MSINMLKLVSILQHYFSFIKVTFWEASKNRNTISDEATTHSILFYSFEFGTLNVLHKLQNKYKRKNKYTQVIYQFGNINTQTRII